MKLLAFLAALLLPALARAQVGPVYPPIQCNAAAQYSSSVAGTTQLVPLATGKAIYICGYDISAAAGSTLQLVYGTGSNCGTGTTNDVISAKSIRTVMLSQAQTASAG